MIAAGIALVALVFIVAIGLTVNAMGWKGAAAVWGFALAMTMIAALGAFLISEGMQS